MVLCHIPHHMFALKPVTHKDEMYLLSFDRNILVYIVKIVFQREV